MIDLDAAYREHAQSVYRFLLAKTGSAQLAEELTQETFFQAVGSIENVWYNAYRRQRKDPVPLEEAEPILTVSAETDVLSHMGREEILTSIHRMPEPGREVLYLRLLGALSFAEIGAILGKTENWARVTYYRAKQLLIKEMRRE